MLSVWMILAAIAVLGCSGLPAFLLSSHSAVGQRLAALFMVLGSIVGLGGIIASFNTATPPTLCAPWFLPWGQFVITIDILSILFLAPVFIVPAFGSIYGLRYWKQSEHPENGRQLVFFYGLLAGSMALVVVARDAVLFLIAWEIMAIAAYFAATAEDDNPDVCRAGWVYLIATHVGTLCLIAMFALWRHATNSFALEPAQGISVAFAGTIFVLSLIGFGFKAGIMPLHVWLPGAHANAPSHVSAVMSAVMLKMGIYGIIRMTALLPVTAVWWGCVVLIAGAITGVAGIAFAIGQNDIKRMLAYSSIENIGIIMIGLGLALLGRSLNQPEWILLGLGGALLHVWNHSLFKSLLFFNAGAIIHASHTRNIDQMGGLAKQMPRTMILFVVGAVAICALPPLNGFAGEWLIYSGLFSTLGIGGGQGFPVAAIAAVPLAMIGALAVACFVKMFGTVFLGTGRCESATHAHDPSASMMIPMAAMAIGCVCIGLFPMIAIRGLDNAARMWASLPEQTVLLTTMAPLKWITTMNLALIVLVGIIALALKKLVRTKVIGEAGTWDCGYAQPTTRIQYTGSSFGQTLVNLFAFILWPKTHWPTIRGFFPRAAHFKNIVPDTVLDRLVLPLFNLAGRYLPSLRVLQQGQTHYYVLYILIIVIILLICGTIGVQS
ncbi:MAG: proton-conducting transporter membrane subunit [Sedimentisphaerales bacterium]|nr:proton-conducting transporter membrane subunit [Sedimentisphaerales bacterium]